MVLAPRALCELLAYAASLAAEADSLGAEDAALAITIGLFRVVAAPETLALSIEAAPELPKAVVRLGLALVGELALSLEARDTVGELIAAASTLMVFEPVGVGLPKLLPLWL